MRIGITSVLTLAVFLLVADVYRHRACSLREPGTSRECAIVVFDTDFPVIIKPHRWYHMVFHVEVPR